MAGWGDGGVPARDGQSPAGRPSAGPESRRFCSGPPGSEARSRPPGDPLIREAGQAGLGGGAAAAARKRGAATAAPWNRPWRRRAWRCTPFGRWGTPVGLQDSCWGTRGCPFCRNMRLSGQRGAGGSGQGVPGNHPVGPVGLPPQQARYASEEGVSRGAGPAGRRGDGSAPPPESRGLPAEFLFRRRLVPGLSIVPGPIFPKPLFRKLVLSRRDCVFLPG